MKYRNLLVQYKGGGYDGCFWEWNFFLFDSKGKFHNLYSSGYKGIENRKSALEFLKDRNFKSECYFYNLKNPKKIKEFQAETNPRLVDKIGEKVNKIYGFKNKDLIYFECDECSARVELDGYRSGNYPRMFHDPHNYSGDGGIGIIQYGKMCEECYLQHSCGYCGEFNEIEENNVDEDGHCKYCVTKNLEAANE